MHIVHYLYFIGHKLIRFDKPEGWSITVVPKDNVVSNTPDIT